MTRNSTQWRRFVAEATLIVGSILLAFAIDAWWDGVQSRDRERVILELVLADLQADSTEIDAANRFIDPQRRRAEWVALNWDRPDLPQDAVEGLAASLQYWRWYRPPNASFMMLSEGGELDIIQSDVLRRDIAEYFEMTQPNLERFVERSFDEREALVDLLWSYTRMRPQNTRDEAGRRRGAIEFKLVVPWPTVQADVDLANQVTWSATVAAGFDLVRGNSLARNASLRAEISARLASIR